MKRSLLLIAFCWSAVLSQAASIPFPAGLIPFNSIANETAKDASGNMLVLGYTNVALLPALVSLPYPSAPNEVFQGTIELAPGVSFSNVFVPSVPQRAGVFSAFSQPLIDPSKGTAFAGNLIPVSRLFGDNGLFAFEVGASNSATPEPSTSGLILGGALAVALLGARKKRTVTRPVEG